MGKDGARALGGQGSDTPCPGANCQAPVCSGQLSSKAESCQDPKFMGNESQVNLLIALTWTKSIPRFADSGLELHPLLEETRLDSSAKALMSMYTFTVHHGCPILGKHLDAQRWRIWKKSFLLQQPDSRHCGPCWVSVRLLEWKWKDSGIMTRFGCPDLKVLNRHLCLISQSEL